MNKTLKCVGAWVAAPFRRISSLRGIAPGWVLEVGKILVGGAIGGWLAWAGAVNASFPPHQLSYWAPASRLATIAGIVGCAIWYLGAREDPQVRLLKEQNAQLHGHLSRLLGPVGAVTEATGPFVAASVGATGAVGSIPIPAPMGTSGPQGAIRGVQDSARTDDSAS